MKRYLHLGIWGVLVLALLLAIVPIAAADSTYVVQHGDTLFRIALNHGLTTAQLAAANGIYNYDLIYAGQVLIIPDGTSGTPSEPPAPAPPAPPAASGSYTIQRGDTLYGIARHFGVSPQALAAANGIYNYDLIFAGQVITIPAGGTASPAPAPAPAPNYGDRWIDVNLTTQTLVAYENSTPVFSTLVSTGTWAHPTVTGQFSIYARYTSQTMDGRRLGYDYYLPNVPYVQYFYRDYGLHGTYWHNNFGTPMSHGCVNLPTPAAEWLYGWSSYGTLVNVHY
jgi:LysM repeat protein